MNPIEKKHSDNLLEALLALHPSGPDGFEGLLGIVLGAVTGQSFRLAKSGSQRGRDGNSAFDGGATYFEGKRYKESPKPVEITAKLLDIVKDDAGQVDLWVIGATCEISAQTESDMRDVCENLGIGAVLLDWNNNDFGPLLVAVAYAGEQAVDFISRNLKDPTKASLIENARAAINYFAAHPDLSTRLESLRSALSADESGLGQAKACNHEWMVATLSSRAKARNAFGQPIAPRDMIGLAAVSRSLEANLTRAFTGTPEAEIYAVIGEEGVGKSWLAASSWLARLQTQSEPICHDGCNNQCRYIVSGEFVISGGDAAEILEPTEHGLHHPSGFVTRLVEADLALA